MYKTEGIALDHIRMGERFINKVFDKFRDNKRVVLEAVSQKGYALNGASPRLKDDRDVVLRAVKNYGYSLQFASDRLKADKEIVLEAIRQNLGSLLFADKALKDEIGDFDPLRYLENMVLKTNLDSSLNINLSSSNKPNKI